ncbi:MAG TPA: hypothetical protein DIU37_01675, partial [Opitutae bacterium]|nr:hypothetical protein [Opitutae bacterium]
TNISERDVRRVQKRAGVMAWQALEAGYKGAEMGAATGGGLGLLGGLFGPGGMLTSTLAGATVGGFAFGCYDAFKAGQEAYNMGDAELEKAAQKAQDAALKLAIQEFATLVKNDPETAWTQVDPIIDGKLDSIFTKQGWDLKNIPGQSCLRYVAKKFTHFLVEQIFVKKYAQDGTMPYMRSQMYPMSIYGMSKSKSLLNATSSIWQGSRNIASNIYESMERNLLGTLEDRDTITDDMTFFDKKYSLRMDDRALQRALYKVNQAKKRIEVLEKVEAQANQELAIVNDALSKAKSPDDTQRLTQQRDQLAATVMEAAESLDVCRERLGRLEDSVRLERGKIKIAEKTQPVLSFGEIVQAKRETAIRKAKMKECSLEIAKLDEFVQAQKQLITDYKNAVADNNTAKIKELGKQLMEETSNSFQTEPEAIAHLKTVVSQVESDIVHLLEEIQEVTDKAVEAQEAEDEAYRVFKEKEKVVIQETVKNCTQLADTPKEQSEKMNQLAYLLNKELITRSEYDEALQTIETSVQKIKDPKQKQQFEHIARTFPYDNIFPANSHRYNTFEVEDGDDMKVMIENFDAHKIEGQDTDSLNKNKGIQSHVDQWKGQDPDWTESVHGLDRSYTVDSRFLSGLSDIDIEITIPKDAVLRHRDAMGMDDLSDEEFLVEQLAFACHGNAPMVTKLTQFLTPETAKAILEPLREHMESMQFVSESGTELHVKNIAKPKISLKVAQTGEGTLVTAIASWEVDKHTNKDGAERTLEGVKPSTIQVGASIVITPNIIEEAPEPTGAWYNPLSWFAGPQDPVIGPPDCEIRMCWEQRSVYDTLSTKLA